MVVILVIFIYISYNDIEFFAESYGVDACHYINEIDMASCVVRNRLIVVQLIH